MNTTLNIGLFGFGCVGQGLYHALGQSKGSNATITRVAVRDATKPRSLPASLITYNKWDILNDPNIHVVVELINDAQEAWLIVSEALRRGKHVVTANKKMLALHLPELLAIQRSTGSRLLYEAAVCASIPVLRTLEAYFQNEELNLLSGIFNGTTNYILSRTVHAKLSYEHALAEAQEKGFAESDASDDVEGYDAAFKTAVLAWHGFGMAVKPGLFLRTGIAGMNAADVRYAEEKGVRIKLTPVIRRLDDSRVAVLVAPRFVGPDEALFHVENEFNGVVIEGRFSGEQFLRGKGAGSIPTGAAVLSDLCALSEGYRYGHRKSLRSEEQGLTNRVFVDVYLRYHSEDDLRHFHFATLWERYSNGSYRYVTGRILLQHLLDLQNYIEQHRLFLCLLNTNLSTI